MPRERMRWFRVYPEITRDLKIRREPPALRWLWVAMMALASDSPRRGWLLLADGVPITRADLADEANIGEDEVAAGLEVYRRKQMVEEVEGVLHLINWDKRQFASDHSADRVERYRQRQRDRDEAPDEPEEDDAGEDVTANQGYNDESVTVTVTPPETENREQSSEPVSEDPGNTNMPSSGAEAPAADAHAASSTPRRRGGATANEKPAEPPEFVEFYEQVYPRQKNRPEALMWWLRRTARGKWGGYSPQDLLAAGENFRTEVLVEQAPVEERFIPYPGTFLGQKGTFLDYLPGPYAARLARRKAREARLTTNGNARASPEPRSASAFRSVASRVKGVS